MGHGLKKALWYMWVITTLIFSIAMVSMPVSALTAVIAAPVIVDTSLTPGSEFSIDITIAGVEKMWGHNFFLYYNTTLLNATGYDTYSPFTDLGAAYINDTAGWVFLSYNMPFGEEVGFSTVESKPLAKITFSVDAYGTSALGFNQTTLADVDANAIPKEEIDGFFANIEVPLHDIAVTAITVSPTAVEINESVTITVTVENQGDFNETFDVSAYYDSELIETKTGVTLLVGASTTINFTWRADVAKGTYDIKATAGPVPEEIAKADNTRTATDSVVVSAEEGGMSPFILYVGAGIAIVIVIIIVVYALKIRKS